MLFVVPLSKLNVLMHGEALHDRPLEAVFFQYRLARNDVLQRPFFSCWSVIQGGNDPGRTGLADLLKCDGIVGSKPVPGFLPFVCS